MAPILRKKKLENSEEEQKGEARKFIDLNDLKFPNDDVFDGPIRSIKVAEVYRYEDVLKAEEFVYNGNILLLDFKQILNDDLLMRRIIDEIKSVSRDVEGDVAKISDNIIAMTPKGISIDRARVKGSFY